MDALIQDLKFAGRQLWKDKGFLLTAGLTLALCMGANATIFSVVNSVILQPLDVPEPERVVTMWNAYPGAMPQGMSGRVRGSNAVPDYYDRRALTDVFAELAVYDGRGYSIEIEGTPQRVRAQEVSPSYFRLLGANAAHGRVFTEEEGEPGANNVVVLSHGLWEQLYGSDASVIGDEMRIDAAPYTIVGVMPRNFAFLDPDVRLWTPAGHTLESRQQYHNNSWSMIARLQPGASLEQAQERVDALNAANMDKVPELKPLLIDAGYHVPLHLLQEDLTHDIRGVLYMLWGGVAFVLLIGGVNVANLVLVRSTARSKEIATRFALGARRRRVVQQLVTEIVVLTLIGGAAGLLLGRLGLDALGTLGIDRLPRSGEISLDATAVAFTLALALAVGIVVALIPVGSLMRLDLSSVFREEGRSGTASRSVRLMRKGMVVAQIAFALILLVGAGLLMSSFRALLTVDTGFEPEGVLTGTVVMTEVAYPEAADLRVFTAEAVETLAALPGVESVGVTSQIPFGGGFSDSVIFAEGYVLAPGESVVSPLRNVVTPGYFQAMGIDVQRGRGFDSRDTTDGQPVIIIDQRMAEHFWPGDDALGKRMWRPDSAEDLMNTENVVFLDVIGIVESIEMRGLDQGTDHGAYYFPYEQQPIRGLDLAVKTAGDPGVLVGAVRGAIADLDPDMPLFDIRSMRERIDGSLTNRRTPMMLTALFSAVALLLAGVGIYGVLAYLVQLRTKEIGIRIALGSDTRSVFGIVLREGAAILALGLVLGVGGAIALRRFIENQLFGVSAMDPRVLALVTTVLGLVALVACVIPARRATRIDPVAALAQE